MKLLTKLFVVVFAAEGVKGFLSDVEWQVILSLVKKIQITRVIFTSKTICFDAVALMKKTSDENVSSVFIRKENLRRYLKNAEFSIFPKTVIVLKERDLKSADYLDDSSIIPSFFWFLFDASNGTLRDELRRVYVPIHTAFLLLEKSSPDDYDLSEYYKIKKSTPGVFRLFAEWKDNHLHVTKVHWHDRKSDFQGYNLTTVKFNENLYLTPKEKINEAIWKELSLILNFTIDQKLIEYSPKNRSVELVKEEEALLDTAIYIENTEKFRYLLGPTWQSRVYMHVRAEGEYKGFTRFLMPFAKYTWWGLGLWMCYCAFFSFLIEYLSRKRRWSDNPSEESYAMAFIPLDSLCNQCGAEISRNVTSRLTFLSIKASSLVILNAYSATWISYLLLYIPQMPFVDLKGFVEDGTYKIIGERNSDVDAFFKVSALPLERLVYTNFLVDVSRWERLDKEVDRMCAGEKLVLVAYDDDVDRYKPCHIVKIRKPLKVVANGFKIKHKSPFRGLLHIKLLLLRTTGILSKLNREISYRTTLRVHSSSVHKVTLEKISSAFFLLLAGYFLSVTIFAIETLVQTFRGRHVQTSTSNDIDFPARRKGELELAQGSGMSVRNCKLLRTTDFSLTVERNENNLLNSYPP